MSVKCTKTDPPTASCSSAYAVTVDGNRIGVVYKRGTSKTGFRNGRCIGQVGVDRWFYRGVDNREQDGGRSFSHGWRTKGDAVDALVAAAKGGGAADSPAAFHGSIPHDTNGDIK